MHVEQKRTLGCTFQDRWPITEVDLHLDHVSEHVLFSRLREAKTNFVSGKELGLAAF